MNSCIKQENAVYLGQPFFTYLVWIVWFIIPLRHKCTDAVQCGLIKEHVLFTDSVVEVTALLYNLTYWMRTLAIPPGLHNFMFQTYSTGKLHAEAH